MISSYSNCERRPLGLRSLADSKERIPRSGSLAPVLLSSPGSLDSSHWESPAVDGGQPISELHHAPVRLTRMDQHAKAVAFQELHQSAFVIPNPWDAGSAKALQALGFPALTTTSAGAAAVTGKRDGDAGRDAVLANAGEIVAAVDLPVAADLENGYDDPAETIRLAAEAGVVGGSIEDFDPIADEIYPLQIALERLSAAVAAARGVHFPFTLVARCENHLHGIDDLDDTISRLQAYEAAGAQVVYAPGLPGLDAVRRVCASVTVPVNVLADDNPVAALVEAGATRISLGSTLYRAALTGLWNAATEIRDAGTFGFRETSLTHAEVQQLFG